MQIVERITHVSGIDKTTFGNIGVIMQFYRLSCCTYIVNCEDNFVDI